MGTIKHTISHFAHLYQIQELMLAPLHCRHGFKFLARFLLTILYLIISWSLFCHSYCIGTRSDRSMRYVFNIVIVRYEICLKLQNDLSDLRKMLASMYCLIPPVGFPH